MSTSHHPINVYLLLVCVRLDYSTLQFLIHFRPLIEVIKTPKEGSSTCVPMCFVDKIGRENLFPLFTISIDFTISFIEPRICAISNTTQLASKDLKETR